MRNAGNISLDTHTHTHGIHDDVSVSRLTVSSPAAHSADVTAATRTEAPAEASAEAAAEAAAAKGQGVPLPLGGTEGLQEHPPPAESKRARKQSIHDSGWGGNTNALTA